MMLNDVAGTRDLEDERKKYNEYRKEIKVKNNSHKL